MVCSETLIALPAPVGGSNGSALMVIPVDNTKINRLQSMDLVTLHNGCGIADYEFDPFRSNRIVTSGDDCSVKLWEVPQCNDDRMSDDSLLMRDPFLTLDGMTKKVTFTKFNPVVDNVLGTAANDGSVVTWDIAARTPVSTVDCKEACQSLEWDLFGRLLCGVFKDKSIRVVDPRLRAVALESPNSHQGNKSSRAVFLSSRNQSTDSGNHIVSCGFAPGAKREMFLWDTRKFSDPVWTNTIDNNSGVIYPFFDECTGMLLLVGKGDGNIRYYEFADSTIYYLNDYRSTSPQRGFCLFPKRVVDQDKSEVLRALKLETSSIQTMSFFVPRRQEAGSSDLYPPCANGLPAIHSVDDWMRITELIAPASGPVLPPQSRSPDMKGVPQLDTKTTASTSSTPRSTASRPNAPLVQPEEFKMFKHQLAAAHRTIEEQTNKIARLEAIVMSVKEPVVSPSPRNRKSLDQSQLVEDLRTEVSILKEKVVKLMNENARLRMAYSTVPRHSSAPVNVLATMSALPVPPPPHPVARSPGRPGNFRP